MSFISRLVNHWRERALTLEFDEELRFHLDSRIDANLRRGMSRAEAGMSSKAMPMSASSLNCAARQECE